MVALGYTLVLLMTLYAFAINMITFANNDYRSIVMQVIGIAALASVLSVVIWRRVPTVGRIMLALCFLIDLWTLIDAAGRRLPAVMGW